MNGIHVDASKLKWKDEYVCWIDIMGTKNIMSESFQKAANFILKFHAHVLNAVNTNSNVRCYPLMDGVFITSSNAKNIKSVINTIFNDVAKLFIETDKNGHRFVIKGSLAYGSISHCGAIDKTICEVVAANESYKQSLMLGMAMIQAYNSEKTAPPFGVYIHESARKYQVLQGKYYSWTSDSAIKESLQNKVVSYFDWCMEYSEYLEMDVKKIDLYKKLAKEYFSDRMKKD